MIADLFQFLRTWGSVIGLGFDIAGACLVYVGVRVSLSGARSLEAPVVPMTINDIGGPAMVEQAKLASENRARERLRAARWSLAGLSLLLIGFGLQAIGSWPKS